MNSLFLLSSGGVGGLEQLSLDFLINGPKEFFFCFAFSGGPIYEEMKRIDRERVVLLNSKKIDVIARRKLCSFCRKKNISVIVLQDLTISLSSLYFYLWHRLHSKGVKFVRYFHEACDDYAFNWSKHLLINKLSRVAVRQSVKKCDAIISISFFVERSWKKYFLMHKDTKKIALSKYHVVYNGISPQIIDEGKTFQPIFSSGPRILFLGRVEEYKGIHQLIEAYGNLPEVERGTLSIVGDGSSLSKEEKYCLENKIPVSFSGFTRDVISEFKKANIFVYPSVWEEGFGLSLVEAMAFGLLCVSSDRGALPEICKNNENGFVFSYSSDNQGTSLVTSLSKAIGLLRRKDECIAVSNLAKKTAEKFTIKNTISGLIEIFTSLN